MKLLQKFKDEDFNGLLFSNLIDFDMKYGHRNNPPGFAKALLEFDCWLGPFIEDMRSDDLLIITADHGNDPLTPSTDHSREYVPLLIYGDMIRPGNIGTFKGFCCLGKTLADLYGGDDEEIEGFSFANLILK
ncbi:MAG: phosphopentomutase, partial [Acetomicrobium sp.]